MLKVGVAGLGRMGKLHLLNALSHSRDVKVVAVADSQRANQKAAERYHIEIYDDYKKMIDAEGLDAVIISLPNFLKKESLLYASERGLAVFVDKPLARNLTEAEEIARKVWARNARLMVGVNYRYFDSVQNVKNIFDEGRVGEVVLASSELIIDGPFSHSLVPKPVPEWWFCKEKAGGGALLDLGYHLVDLFCWMFGDLEVEFSVLGHRFGLPVEDTATVVLKSTETGTRCSLNVGWFSKMIFPNFNFRINLHGTVGYVSTDHFAPRNLYLHVAKEATINLLRRVTGKKVNYLSYTYYYASFAKVLERFFNSIKNDADFPITLEGQLNVLRVIESIYVKDNAAKNEL